MFTKNKGNESISKTNAGIVVGVVVTNDHDDDDNDDDRPSTRRRVGVQEKETTTEKKKNSGTMVRLCGCQYTSYGLTCHHASFIHG